MAALPPPAGPPVVGGPPGAPGSRPKRGRDRRWPLWAKIAVPAVGLLAVGCAGAIADRQAGNAGPGPSTTTGIDAFAEMAVDTPASVPGTEAMVEHVVALPDEVAAVTEPPAAPPVETAPAVEPAPTEPVPLPPPPEPAAPAPTDPVALAPTDPPAPPPPPVEAAAPLPTQAPPPPPPPPAEPAASTLDPRFSTCKEAKAHGYGPYYEGVDPEYGWYWDRDHDGIVCE